ncbi:hypothetical protein BDZ89DRAFT_1063024 [Hymenopellis radicata]|nr:hypothetical protein BDZ89DRAFT_1063024 [Hymenopellis radicata]
MASSPASVAQGPMMIGLMFNFILLGVVMTQAYIYMITYSKRDKSWMQSFVFIIVVANIVNSVFIAVDLYNALINNFNNTAYLAKATWLFATDPALTGIIAAAVQLFFAWRVKVLTSNWSLTTIVCLLALTGAVGGIVTAVEIKTTPSFVDFQKFQTVVIIWLVASCLGDLAITCILVWYLRKHKTGFQGSDELVDRIIRMTVQTGLITSICAIVDLILFLANPTGLHLIFNFPLCKLYTNTLLSSLNSRSGWAYSNSKQSHSQSGLTATIGGTISDGRKQRTVNATITTQTRAEVFVHVEHHELQDRTTTVPRFVIQQDGNERDDIKSPVWDGKQGQDDIV